MKRLLILAEGQTEEAFIKTVLAPHLSNFGLLPIPKIITTKRVVDRPDFKGGVGSFAKIEREVRLLLNDTDATLVTTLLDYYGLPADFPAVTAKPNLSAGERVKLFEQAFGERIKQRRFLPFLMLHEFEALLFSAPHQLAALFPGNDQRTTLMAIRTQFPTPEEIDDSPATAPSKRLQKLLPEYRKRLHGVLAAQKIGLELMRQECPDFNEWLTKLEAL